MSVVYRARAEDGTLQVAALEPLTLGALGALADRGLERFRQEQAVLVRLPTTEPLRSPHVDAANSSLHSKPSAKTASASAPASS